MIKRKEAMTVHSPPATQWFWGKKVKREEKEREILYF